MNLYSTFDCKQQDNYQRSKIKFFLNIQTIKYSLHVSLLQDLQLDTVKGKQKQTSSYAATYIIIPQWTDNWLFCQENYQRILSIIKIYNPRKRGI